MASLINYLWGGGKKETTNDAPPASASTTSADNNNNNDNTDEKYSSLSLASLASSSSSSSSSDILHQSIVSLSEVRFDNNGSGGRLLKPIPRCESLLLSINRCGPYQYELCGILSNEIMFRYPINSSLIAYFSPAENSFVWLMPWPHHMTAIHAAFQSVDDENKFNSIFTKVVYESSRQENYEKTVKESDSKWIESAYRGGGDMDIDSDEESYSFSNRQSIPKKQLAPEFSDDDNDDNNNSNNDTDDDDNKSSSSSSATAARLRSLSLGAKGSIRIKNEHLSVGLAQNRTFVARGNRLGVFRHEDGELNFITKTELKRLKGTTMTPMRVLLKERDTKVAMIDSNDNTKVVEMDVETGKIVCEYGGYADDMAIRNIGLTTKYEELNNNPMVLGVNANSVFSLDPRQHGTNKIAQKQIYTVATKNSCVTATKEGFVAVGSDKGEIRLYDSIDKRAKSMLPGLGDPIIGMDVTGDGKWLLATTKHYLLLIPTALDNENKNGFQKSISSKASPPIKLQLSTRDIIKNQIQECTFSTAHFDINIDNEEEWIVASTGPFVVKWNFKKIKQSTKNVEYTITKSVENVVDAVFLPGRADQVMIALPDNVYLEKLQKNTKRY